MASNQELHERRVLSTPRGSATLSPFFVSRALGAELWDVQGQRYIDFGAGVAALNTGHCHPMLMQAVENQLHQFIHTGYQITPYESYIALAEKINRITPGDEHKKTVFFSTGAEAVENAIKIAKIHSQRLGVIALSGSFHGRTFMALSLTGMISPYKDNLMPLSTTGVYHIPSPMELHGGSVEKTLNALENLFHTVISPQNIAAIIFEPVLGEGGFYVMPAELIRAFRQICDRHGIVLIADEIQTGFARTGKLFAVEHAGVIPDLMVVAKGLAGGMPLSAVTGRADIMDAPEPGVLGGTYAGNPLAIAAAHAVLDIIENESLCERALILGDKLKTHLYAIQKKQPRIAQIRGLGSMLAIELLDPNTKKPDVVFTKYIQTQAFSKGLLLLTCGIYKNVVRFLYPLTIEIPIFEEGISVLTDILLK